MKWYFLLVLWICFLTIPSSSFAQTESSTDSALVSTDAAEVEKEADYILPYAGLLPDNPFYILKTVRDRVVNFLITDPVKKIEFRLLQADKRLSAGVVLFKQSKPEVAESTISKGENYFGEAVDELRNAQSQGVDVRFLAKRLYLAAKKHRLIILGLQEKSTGNIKEKLHTLEERVDGFEKDVDSLRLENK